VLLLIMGQPEAVQNLVPEAHRSHCVERRAFELENEDIADVLTRFGISAQDRKPVQKSAIFAA
jgi:hypothetical protein